MLHFSVFAALGFESGFEPITLKEPNSISRNVFRWSAFVLYDGSLSFAWPCRKDTRHVAHRPEGEEEGEARWRTAVRGNKGSLEEEREDCLGVLWEPLGGCGAVCRRLNLF